MQVGINENFNYDGEVYHAQTEDGGVNNPVITTVLFRGGTIIASKRTNYSDILKSDKLALVVGQIMREQHRGVLKDLVTGILVPLKKSE